MARVGIIVTGLTGMTKACLAMATKLKSSGYQITFLCPIDINVQVRREGFKYIQLPEIRFDWTDYKGSPTDLDEMLEYASVSETRGILKSLNLDLLLVDMELHEIIITAYQLEIKLILISPWYSNVEIAGLPPIDSTYMPGKGLISALKIWLKWRRRQYRILKKLIRYRFFRQANRRVFLQYYLKQLPTKLKVANSEFPPIFEYQNLPIVIINQQELEFPHKHPPNATYGGAMVFTGDQSGELDSPDLQRLEHIIRDQKQTGKQLIYCSLSSLSKDETNFAERLNEAVAKEPNWILIITTGKQTMIDFEPAENVHVFTWVPQLRVLEVAACNINHGGIHTINECIHTRTPMLIYSGNRFDQNGCAARVVYHGIGLRGERGQEKPEQIHMKLDQIMKDKVLHENLSRIHSSYVRSEQTNELLNRIAQLLNEEPIM